MKNSKSPFKRFSHSREGSTDEHGSFFHKRSISGSSTHMSGPGHSRNVSGSGAPPVSGIKSSHKRNTSASSRASQNSNFLADQYERDRRAIINCCFSLHDGKPHASPNNYITHVRVIEDSRSPSSRPPPDSKLEHKKKRVLILSCKPGNPSEVQLHKGRENSEGSFQIGRTWELKELTKIEGDAEVNEGFTFTMGKKYYWETNSAKERTVFVKSLINTFMQAFDGHVPELLNWDLSMFYLDEKSYERAVIRQNTSMPRQITDSVENKPVLKQITKSASQPPKSKGGNDLPSVDSERPISKQSTPSLSKAPYTSSPTIIEANKSQAIPQEHNIKQEQISRPLVSSINQIQNAGLVDSAVNAVASAVLEKNRKAQTPEPKPTTNQHSSRHDYKSLAEIKSPSDSHSTIENDSFTARNNDNLLENLNYVLSGNQTPSGGFSQKAEEPFSPTDDNENNSSIRHQSIAKVESLESGADYEPIAIFGDDEDLNATISDGNGEGTIEDTYEDIYEDTYEDVNELSFEKGDEVRYSQALDPENSHTYHEVSTIQEETPIKAQIKDGNETPQNSSAGKDAKKSGPKKIWDIEDEEMLEILSDINWQMDDDADKLIERLNSKMAETEYNFNKGLLSLENLGPSLSPYEEKVDEECDKMNPILSLFLMEMGNVAEDIEYIEGQENGLQVESANKKQLWDTLTELMNTVSLDDETLSRLLNTPVSEKNLTKMESQLVDLFKALKAISGERDEEGYNLGEMRALKQRRETYEKVTKMFLERLVAELNGKFGDLNRAELSEEHLNSFLSRLLCYSSLTLFCKDISSGSYYFLIERWNVFISEVYKKMVKSLMEKLEGLKIKSSSAEQHTIANQFGLDRLLIYWAAKRNHVENVHTPNEAVVIQLDASMETIKNWCVLYQNFIDSFFHISSKLNYEQFIQQFSEPSSRIVSLTDLRDLQSDRESASTELQLVSKVFQPVLTQIATYMIDILRHDRSLAPALMILLEQEVKSLESSNAEFLMTALSRLFVQVKQLWSEFIDEQVVHIQRISMNFSSRILFPVVTGLTVFVNNSQKLISISETKLDIKDDSSFETLTIFDDACRKLSCTIVKLLNTKSDTANQMISNNQAPTATSSDIDRVITLLMNADWLFETFSVLNSKGIFDQTIQAAKKIFDTEKDVYATHLLRDAMPKLTSFIDGAINLTGSTSAGQVPNPSNWAAYSRNNLDNILAGYTSSEIEVLIKRLHEHMLRHFSNEPDDKMKTVICDKLWSCMQGHTVSLYLKLYTLIEKHYKGTYVKFTKNDIITAFESYKRL